MPKVGALRISILLGNPNMMLVVDCTIAMLMFVTDCTTMIMFIADYTTKLMVVTDCTTWALRKRGETSRRRLTAELGTTS